MPSLVLSSNVEPANLKEFVLDFSKFAAATLSKPEKYISIDYRHSPALSFAGTLDPAFLMVITSLGNVNPEANIKYSNAFFTYLKEKLGVPGDRGYIEFVDPGNAHLGHENTTFTAIFGK